MSRMALHTLAAWLMLSAALDAQKLPPVEPPKPMPQQQSDTATLHITTTEVLVPTLVEKRGGGVVYGLKPDDFVLEDNGVPQKIRVQEEMDSAPVALVVAVEQGGVSVLEFDKLAKLGPLLDMFLTDPRSQAALMGFDSKPHLIHDYTHSGETINDSLNHLEPGDGGAAILDTISSAVDLLETQPKEYRRVLLLISEERDHGSKHTKVEQLIPKIGASDVLVLSVAFSPALAQLSHDTMDDLKGNGDQPTMSMISTLVMLIKAFKKNVTKEVAQMSGGEYTTFVGDKKFEQRVLDAAKHMRNRYLITFSPSDPTPGLHTIRVRTTQDYGARIVARADYWLTK
ncbi:MAG TPA: VWA domain-containing protein [Terracidiphilus sp.]|nr:VWA domain-containing protein [Terracidiphilus sp.]